MKSCIFCCVFNQEKYVEMFYLLLESINIYGNLGDNVDLLVYTSTPFMNMIKQSHLFNERVKFEINDTYDSIELACKARLDLFNLECVSNYDKILYLDTDVLVKDDIVKVFNVINDDILYVLEEGTIDHYRDFYGATLFGEEINNYEDKTGFTSGIMAFNNCEKIKDLFHKIKEDIINRPHYFECHDQPYIIYSAFKYNLYNNKILKSLVVNNDLNIFSDKVIHHFPGGPGHYGYKLEKMSVFLNEIKNSNVMKNVDVKLEPKINNILPDAIENDDLNPTELLDETQIINKDDENEKIIDDLIKEKLDDLIKEKLDDLIKEKLDDLIKEKLDVLIKEKLDVLIKEKLDDKGVPDAIENDDLNPIELLDETQIINKDDENETFIYSNNMKIVDVKLEPTKNIVLPLIGLCVSYDYYDTLQFTLPVNYLHFDKIYLITQVNDVTTIEFSQRFDNVEILFYDFTNNNKKFDKFGGLNYAQKIAYEQYPDSWYLILDSDTILPNNFIDILIKENLNTECIYGAIRNNVLKTSELLNKTQIINKDENKNFVYNNIVWRDNTPPSIIGCFQLYKKKVYHRDNLDNAGHGDYYFGYDNFDTFCNLDNLTYFHLGETGTNWGGKVISFIDDIGISLNDIYYICKKDCNNIYYDSNRTVIKYGNSKNIDDDVWTCSEKMRYDIYDFFKDKTHFKIAEIGSHKGYSTKILSKIFSKVYAVDNSIEWTNFSKEFNKDIPNIEYVMLNIYTDSWDILPDDIEVTFIDADHSYQGCKSDIMNSINRLKNLQYIILDDYGVWNGVKQIVDELIENKTFKFERFIGITDVPGPNNIVVKNVNEGIICSIVRP
jgi:hypothetical protein